MSGLSGRSGGSGRAALAAWEAEVTRRVPTLSRMQARGLALWSFGVVLAQCCGQRTVAAVLATLLQQKHATVRQRVREWLYEARVKRGQHRRTVEVEPCFVWLLRWVLSWWPAQERRLALALDATTLGDRFTVLALCVVYRGCAIPVAWAVVGATARGAWRPHWERLLQHLVGSVPADWTVIVLADRGLYAPWLYHAIVALHWHPFLRLNAGAKGSGLYRPVHSGAWRPLSSLLPAPGTAWSGAVVCFREQPVRGTLLARWEPGYKEGWLVLTDLEGARAEVAWYGMRAWVECGFKTLKRAGWQWQKTRMRDPERAARLWLVLAVATLWMVSIGSVDEEALPASSLADLPPTHVARRTARGRPASRLISCFRRGLLAVHVHLMEVAGTILLPLGRLQPDPWPTGIRMAPG